MSVTANLFLSHLKYGSSGLIQMVIGYQSQEILRKIKASGFNLSAAYDWRPIETSLGYTFVDRRGWDPSRKGFSRDLNFFGPTPVQSEGSGRLWEVKHQHQLSGGGGTP